MTEQRIGTEVAPDGTERPITRGPQITLDELRIRFSYHSPRADQMARYQQIRALALSLAVFIVDNTPACREQSLAITALEEAVYCANAAIARRE